MDKWVKYLFILKKLSTGGVDNFGKPVDNFFFSSLRRIVLTSYPQVIHRLSTGYPQVIHRLSTGYPQVIHRAKSLLVDHYFYSIDNIAQLFVSFETIFYCMTGMQNCRMVLSSKSQADHWVGGAGKLPAEKHAYLPWKRNDLCSFL